MGSILERSRPPTRTPSKTSHAFRSNKNDYSPFGSLAELKAATTSNPRMPTPHGSQVHGGGSRAMSPNPHPNNLAPTPEHDDDDMGSFYGEEADYGNVTHQLHPDDAYLHEQGRSYPNSHGGSPYPSQPPSGWGSRAGSANTRGMDTPLPPPHGAYSDHEHEQQYAAQNWPGSHAGTNRGHPDDFENHVPTIQVHPDDEQYMYPHPMPIRTKSSRGTILHSRSPSAGINHDEDDPYPHPPQARTPSFHPPSRTKSSRASIHRAQSIVPKGSRATIRSFARPGALPAHFETEGDNVILQVWLPWTERLNERPCRFHITGVDGKEYSLEIDYRWMKAINGTAKFRGAGMPRERGLGRGHLIIEWEIWFNEDEESFSDG